MKRVLSLFLSCIFVLGVCFSTPIIASAAGDDLILRLDGATTAYEPYIFEELTAPGLGEEKGTCALVGYTGNDIVTIESADINSDKGFYILTKIASTAFSNGIKNTTLTIPANITSIEDGAFVGCTALTAFALTGENNSFSVSDGVLFNKDGTKLIAYPAAKEGTEYTIPSDVTEIATGAFADCANLKYIFTEKTPFGENDAITIGENNIFSQSGVYHEGLTAHNFSGEVGSEKCTVCCLLKDGNDKQHTWENGICEVCGLICKHTGVTCGETGECNTCKATYTASHEWTFTKPEEGNVIIATCGNANCNYAEGNSVTVTLVAPTGELVYNGTEKEATIVVKKGEETLENVPFEINGITYTLEETPVDECINAGVYTASITLGEGENATAEKEFTINPKIIEVELAPGGEQENFEYDGHPHELTVYFIDAVTDLDEDDDYTVEYQSNINAGEIIGTVNLREGGNYAFLDGETLTYSKTINSGINIEKVTPEVTIVKAENLVFTNEEQPLLTTANTTFGTLKFSLENTEDETKWSTDIPTASAVGTHTVYYKVVGDSNVNDLEQQSVEVTISAHNHLWSYEADEETDTITATCEGAGSCNYKTEGVTITLEAPEIPDDATSLIYDGFVKEATVTISAENTGITPNVVYTSKTGGVQLVEGKCINAGNYTASITLLDKDENETTVTVSFTIERATATVTAPTAITGLVYNGGEQELVNAGTANSGVLEYSLDNETWSEDIPEGLEAGEYTVYYRVGITDNYNGVDGNVNVTIAPKTITATVEPIADQIYTGSAIEPTVVVKDGETVLSSETDYDVSYSGNTDVGEATVTITFKGNYSGTTTKEFTIKTKDVSTIATVEAIEDQEYTGEEIKPLVVVKDGETELSSETDYDVSYSGNTDVGEATVTITFKGNYKGAVTAKFNITKAQAVVTPPTANTTLTYTGEEQELLVTVGLTTFGEIEYSLDEKIWSTTIPTATEKGEYTVYYRVQGTENYDGANGSLKVTIEEHQHDWEYSASGAVITATCQNNGCDIKTTTVELVAPENLVYDGTEKSVTVKAPHADLLSEYTLSHATGADVGTYTAYLSIGEGDKVVTVQKSFTITPALIVVTKVTAIDRVYDGNLVVSINKTDGIVYTGLIDGDKVGFDLSALTGTLSDANVGSNKTVKVNGSIVLTGEDAKNYVVSTPDVTNVNITPATVTITPDAKTSEQYYDLPALTYKVTGLIGADTLTKAPTLTTNADIKKTGDYTITAAGAEASANYVIKYATAPLTITAHKNHIVKDGTWKETVHGTCMVAGKEAGTCTLCSGTVTRDSKIDPNNHALITTVTKKETCTQNGEALVTCANGCSYSLKTTLPADGELHNFAEDFTVIESTCVAKGSKYKVCQNPGCKVVSEKTEIAINPDAHKNIVTINAKEATCEEKGYTGDEFCNDCKKIIDPGIEINAKGHTESDWIVDKEPTFTEEGAKHTACTVCKKELKKEVIAKRALEIPEVKIENASNGIKVSWSQDEDATGYTVYSSTYNATTKKWSAWKNRGTAAATKSSWTDKTVSEGVTYRYTVRSVNGTNKSNYKATSGLCYVVAPKVTVSITSTGLLAKWNKVNNATSYIVYRRALVNGVWSSWVNLGSTKAEKNTWSDTSVQSGVTYRYTVRAVVGKVKSGYTASSSIIYLAQPLLKISNANTGITGKWDPIAGATGYTIYRSEYNPSTKKWSKWLTLGTTGATAKTFTDKTVKSGYEYKYTIRAVSGKFKSTYQDSNKLVYLAQPTLKISNVANGIQGKWNQVDGAKGYIIYRSELKDGKWTGWTNLGTSKSTAKTFTDKTVKSGVTYKYTIRAKNGSYKSSYVASNQSVFLSVPTVKISNGITGVNVSWSKIEGATSYLVYRRELVDGKWTKWAEFKTVSETSLVDETVKSGTNYRYTVRALNGKSRSMYTSTGTLYYLTAPTVTVEKVDGVIKVNWTQTVGAKGYTIYRAELGADGKWSKWVTLGTATEKYSSCKDKTAKTGVTYKYTVRAVNGKVKSAYVDGAQITNQ